MGRGMEENRICSQEQKLPGAQTTTCCSSPRREGRSQPEVGGASRIWQGRHHELLFAFVPELPEVPLTAWPKLPTRDALLTCKVCPAETSSESFSLVLCLHHVFVGCYVGHWPTQAVRPSERPHLLPRGSWQGLSAFALGSRASAKPLICVWLELTTEATTVFLHSINQWHRKPGLCSSGHGSSLVWKSSILGTSAQANRLPWDGHFTQGSWGPFVVTLRSLCSG